MAFRIEKTTASLLIWGAMLVGAQPLAVQVRHEHLHGGGAGMLSVDADSMSFHEEGKKGKHSRDWRYEDIQQLSLSPGKLHLVTYEDQKWELGRDRDFIFDQLPQDFVGQARPLFERKLGRRFIVELADSDATAVWELGAKLRHGLRGSQGVLRIGDDRIVYESKPEGESRTWKFEDIDNVSVAGPFDLSITTLERTGWRHAGPTEFRFQLKDELKEDRYNELWRRINRTKTTPALQSSEPDHRYPAGQGIG